MANELFRVDGGYGFGSGNGNITSTDSLVINANTLSVSANITNLGNVGNISIGGGSNGQVLTTNGSGNLSWTTVSGGSGSSNTIYQTLANVPNANVVITAFAGNYDEGSGILNYYQASTYFIDESNVGSTTFYVDFRQSVTGGPYTSSVNSDAGYVYMYASNSKGIGEVSIGADNIINITGNVTFTSGNLSLGNISFVHINGGNSGEVLSTDGSGNLSWVSAGGSTPTEILSTLDGGNAKVITSATLSDYGSGDVYTYSAAIYLNDSSENYFSAPISASISQASNNGPFSTDVNIITGNLYIAATTSSGTGNIQFVSEDTITVGATNNVEFQTNVRVTNNKTVDLENASNITLGNVGNLHITGGSSGQVLSTDGAGNLSWITASGGGGSPGGNTTEIQFNDSGSFAGSNELTFSTIPLPAVGTVVNAENISIKKGVFGVHITNSIGEVNGGGNVTPLAYDSGNNRKFGFFSYESPSSDLNMLPPTGNAQAYEIYNGETIKLRFTGNSAGNRNITWTTSGDYSYQEIGVTLPSVIVADKTTYVTCIFNDVTTRWDVVDVKAQT
jgi:hypothetical protein